MVLLATHSLLTSIIPNAVSYALTMKWKKIVLKLKSSKELFSCCLVIDNISIRRERSKVNKIMFIPNFSF